MKVIKLNRRYRQFKEYGHTVGIKFPGRTPTSLLASRALRELTGTSGWARDDDWYAYSGQFRSDRPAPYFITIRNENLLSAVLLKIT